MLDELVTSQNTKATKSSEELALSLNTETSRLDAVLAKLVQARLLRASVREAGGLVYELVHEYLIRNMAVDTEVQKRKRAEELIKQEVENWQRFGL